MFEAKQLRTSTKSGYITKDVSDKLVKRQYI